MDIETERKLRDFVYQNVHANVGQMVEYILNKAEFSCLDDDAPFCWQDVLEAQNFENLPLDELLDKLSEEEGDIADSEYEDALEEALDGPLFDMLSEEDDLWEAFLFWVAKNPLTAHEEIDTAPLARLAEAHSHPEVYEWWMVDSWFARKLQERGEIVIDGNIWGRQCTGQSIVLDWVTRDIYKEVTRDGE